MLKSTLNHVLQILIYFKKLESGGGLSVDKGAVQGLGQNLSFVMGEKKDRRAK